MLVLRYMYVLAIVVWLGGMVILGAIVAPTTFQVLEARDPAAGRVLAAAVFGASLNRFQYVAYGCGLAALVSLSAMAVLGPRPARFALRSGIAAAMLLVAAYAGFVVYPGIDVLQREIGVTVSPSTLPADDARRIQFEHFHTVSTRLMMANMIGALALLYWQARE